MPTTDQPEPLTVSVVIPTFNRRERLERVLRAVAAQTYAEPLEVVVVSDGSTDGTDEYLASDRPPLPVVAIRQDNSGPAVARNHGVESATGELVVFLDDDVVPTPTLIEAHVEAHRRLGPKAVVIGPMLDPPDHRMSPWVRWEQAMLTKQYDAMERGDWAATARQFYTGNASVRRQWVLDVGGFDPGYLRAEDTELAYRLADRGAAFDFEPAAVGLHYAERSYASWRAVADAYGRNVELVAREGHPRILELAFEEWHDRHRLLRAVTRAVIGRPRSRAAVEAVLRGVAVLADRARLERISGYAVSGIHGIVYYDALADAVGGRSELLAGVARSRRAASPGPAH